MANQVAYGFVNLTDVFTDRVADVGEQVVGAAIQASVTEHMAQLTSLMSIFVKTGVPAKTRFLTPTVARLQPMDENGRARPIQVSGHYDVSFPIQMGGAAWGSNFISKAKLTVEEANRYTNALISADMRWMRDRILAGLFANVDWTYYDENDNIGTLTIHGLANGDTVKYLIQAGADDGAIDTHYLAQAAAIATNTDPFPAIYSELMEHPENSGECVAFIPTNLKTAVMGLAGFHPVSDPNLRVGANTDVVVGGLNVPHPGELFGYHDSKVWLVEWRSMVSSYIIATSTGGESPLGMREDDEAELRGFRMVGQRDDYPYSESQWFRRAGFGAWNRVGAVVQLIGNGSYSVPTGYACPIK